MTKRCRILSVDPDGARAKVFFKESESCDLCQDGCGARDSCARGLSVLSAVNGKGLALSPGMIVLIRAPRRAAVIQFRQYAFIGFLKRRAHLRRERIQILHILKERFAVFGYLPANRQQRFVPARSDNRLLNAHFIKRSAYKMSKRLTISGLIIVFFRRHARAAKSHLLKKFRQFVAKRLCSSNRIKHNGQSAQSFFSGFGAKHRMRR